jgi:hypothetical protein
VVIPPADFRIVQVYRFKYLWDGALFPASGSENAPLAQKAETFAAEHSHRRSPGRVRWSG